MQRTRGGSEAAPTKKMGTEWALTIVHRHAAKVNYKITFWLPFLGGNQTGRCDDVKDRCLVKKQAQREPGCIPDYQ